MKKLCTVQSDMKHCIGNVNVILWEHGDPFPRLGPSVGVDTETELITDTMPDPPMVVLGVFDKASMTCYVIYWYDAPEFMRELCCRDIEQRYFNVGFDEQVLDNEDPEKSVMEALDSEKVRDMQIRIHLHEIATLGYIRGKMHSLKDCSLELLGVELDKGDGTENSARLSFHRTNPDGSRYQITDEQARYLPFDCISTWCLGEAVPEMPTEIVHTRGMVVLAHISKNGFDVDRTVFDSFVRDIKEARQEFRNKLVSFGFPDPFKNSKQETKDRKARFADVYAEFLAMHGQTSGLKCEQVVDPDTGEAAMEPAIPKKVNLRLAVCYLYAHEQEPSELTACATDLKIVMENKISALRKNEKDLYNQLCEDYGLLAYDTASKPIVMYSVVAEILAAYIEQEKSGAAALSGFDFRAACEQAGDLIDQHPDWLTSEKPIGPRKFFQQHVRRLLENNPGLELNRTEKSGEIKLTLNDMWRLQDRQITDKFLDAYTGYNHCDKYLSTYLKPEFIKSDGKVHARFTNILRTGRTSCSKPLIASRALVR